jgi:L-rhamnose mutarotase
MMQVGLRTRIKPGLEERYEEYHRAVWPEVVQEIRRAGITKYVIFRDGLDVFHYIECDDYDRAIAEIGMDPVSMKWEAEIAMLMEATHDFSGESSDRMKKIWQL